jgi:hypothetical protein
LSSSDIHKITDNWKKFEEFFAPQISPPAADPSQQELTPQEIAYKGGAPSTTNTHIYISNTSTGGAPTPTTEAGHLVAGATGAPNSTTAAGIAGVLSYTTTGSSPFSSTNTTKSLG